MGVPPFYHPAAAELVKARLLLPEDAERYVGAATTEDIVKRFGLEYNRRRNRSTSSRKA